MRAIRVRALKAPSASLVSIDLVVTAPCILHRGTQVSTRLGVSQEAYIRINMERRETCGSADFDDDETLLSVSHDGSRGLRPSWPEHGDDDVHDPIQHPHSSPQQQAESETLQNKSKEATESAFMYDSFTAVSCQPVLLRSRH